MRRQHESDGRSHPASEKEEAKFQCSACGADRGCNCNALAVDKIEKALTAQERRRVAEKERREKAKENNGRVDHGNDDKSRKMPAAHGGKRQTTLRFGLHIIKLKTRG